MASSHLLIVAMKGTIPSFPKPGRLAKNLARGVCFGARSLQPQWNRCSKRKLIFQPRCFRCYVRLREGMSCLVQKKWGIEIHLEGPWQSLHIFRTLCEPLRPSTNFSQLQGTSQQWVRPYFNPHITLARKVFVLCTSFHHLYSTTSLSAYPDMSTSVCRQPKMRRFQRSQVAVSLRRERPCLKSKLPETNQILEKNWKSWWLEVGRRSFSPFFWGGSILSGPKC